MRKILAVMLTTCLLATVFPIQAFAQEDNALSDTSSEISSDQTTTESELDSSLESQTTTDKQPTQTESDASTEDINGQASSEMIKEEVNSTTSDVKDTNETEYAQPDAETQALVDEIKANATPRKAMMRSAALTFEQSLAQFPSSYHTALKALHDKYPDWKFEAVDTGLSFTTSVTKESAGLVQNGADDLAKSNAPGDYDIATGKYDQKDAGWVRTTRSIVSYFLDPRNFLDEREVFMFESNRFNASIHTEAGVESVLSGTFMSNKKITYINTSGKTVNLDVTYGQTILTAGQKSGVNPYYLAAKIRQEVGANGSGSTSGTYVGPESGIKYTGYYNFYNIGAYDSEYPIENAMKRAKKEGWDSPIKSIEGGAEFIGNSYITKGQDTSYSQRFNVHPDAYYPTYTHQYMTSIFGAASEASSTYNAHKGMGSLAQEKIFYIPVYDSMPDQNAMVSINKSVKTGKVVTSSSSLTMRSKASLSGSVVANIPKGATVTILDGSKRYEGNYTSNMFSYPYWYHIRVSINGKTYEGYVSERYITLNTNNTLTKGQKKTISYDMSGKTGSIYFETSNPAVATVDSKGVISAVGIGTATIFAHTGNGSFDAIAVKVQAPPNERKVTFDANGGKVSTTSKTVIYGSTFGTLPTPTRSNYVFNGWYTAKSGGSKVTSSTKVTASGGITLYAQWDKNIAASTVTVSSVSSQNYTGSAIKPKPVVKDGSTTLKEGTHYTLSYSNNTNAGTATISIIGKGSYSGTKKITFTIKEKLVSYSATTTVNYRSGAGTSYSVKGQLKKGASVSVVSGYSKSANGYTWSKIKISGKYYYVASKYLKPKGSSSGSGSSSTQEKLGTYVATTTINYRSGAGTSYSVKGQLKKGASVSVVSGYSKSANGYTWSKIKIGSKYYYAASKYLQKKNSSSGSSGSSSDNSSSSKEVLKVYTTTATINYRSGAGTSYSVRGQLKKGASVSVVSGYSKSANGYTWSKIKISGKYYYVASKYLKAKSSSSSSSSTSKEKLVTYKATTTVRYRTGAGTSYRSSGLLYSGKKVSVVSGYSKSANGYTWSKIKISGKYYYVASKYLRKA